MSLLLSDEALRARSAVAHTELAPLADSLTRELAPVCARELYIPADKALLSREGGRCTRDGATLQFSFGGPSPAASVEVTEDTPAQIAWHVVAGPPDWVGTDTRPCWLKIASSRSDSRKIRLDDGSSHTTSVRYA